jgi:hypothetical protein
MNIRQIAAALGGDVTNSTSCNVPGPGHSKADRSLSITVRGGRLVVNSFARDDWKVCRDYVHDRLGLGRDYESNNRRKPAFVVVDTGPDEDKARRKAFALKLWQQGTSLLDFFRIVRATLMKQFQLASSVNDRRAVAALAGRLNEVLTSIGGVTGEMLKLAPTSITNNTSVFINSPIFVDLQSMLVRKLADHPEALSRVVEDLQELEAGVAPASNGAPLIDVKPLEARVDA